MKRHLFATLIAAFATFFMSTAFAADELIYKVNPDTEVIIKKIDCPLPRFKDKTPWAAVGHRIDTNQYIFGCFGKDPKNSDLIYIQWSNGDFSSLPANGFLTDEKSNLPKEKPAWTPPANTEPTL